MKKILLVTTVPETFASILKTQPKYLSKHFEVTLASSPEKLIEQVSTNESVNVFGVKMYRGISPVKDFFSLWAMIKLIRSVNPDLIHSYTPKAGLIAMLASWFCRTPIRIHTFTGLIFPTTTGFKQKILIAVDRLICKCATHIIPEGNGVKRDLWSYKITSKPLKILGSGNIAGVNTAFVSKYAEGVNANSSTLSKSLEIPQNAFVFCFIGRLNKDKGINELIEAFLGLTSNCYLVIAGKLDSTAPISPALQKTINTHPRIKSLGHVSDVRLVMNLSQVLVLPSYREGFPNVVLEAGAMEIPAIVTNVNGSNEIIEPNINGWVVPPQDSAALAKAMEEAKNLTNSELKNMGIVARKRICERFERSEYLKCLTDFYRKLLNEV